MTMKDCEEIREWYGEYRAPKEDSRIKFAKSELEKRGYEVTHDVANKCLIFEHKGNKIRLFPYTGWFTGKGIKDGRGLQTLLKRLL